MHPHGSLAPAHHWWAVATLDGFLEPAFHRQLDRHGQLDRHMPVQRTVSPGAVPWGSSAMATGLQSSAPLFSLERCSNLDRFNVTILVIVHTAETFNTIVCCAYGTITYRALASFLLINGKSGRTIRCTAHPFLYQSRFKMCDAFALQILSARQ